MNKLYKISEVSKILGLIYPRTKKPLNYILRYWEKEFKIIKPKKINNRRYYSSKQLEILKIIYLYLKKKGMMISGVKKLIRQSINNLDEDKMISLKDVNYKKEIIKIKSKNLLRKLRDLKNYGKKNSY